MDNAITSDTFESRGIAKPVIAGHQVRCKPATRGETVREIAQRYPLSHAG